MIFAKEFFKRLAGRDRVGRPRPEESVALGQTRGLACQISVLIDLVKEIAACCEEVDLVRRDEGSELAVSALDALDDVSILLPLGVDRQVAADQLDVAQAELLRPRQKQPYGCRSSSADADKSELRQVARVRDTRRACSL
jgi:hypothetical protein